MDRFTTGSTTITMLCWEVLSPTSRSTWPWQMTTRPEGQEAAPPPQTHPQTHPHCRVCPHRNLTLSRLCSALVAFALSSPLLSSPLLSSPLLSSPLLSSPLLSSPLLSSPLLSSPRLIPNNNTDCNSFSFFSFALVQVTTIRFSSERWRCCAQRSADHGGRLDT
eukprot:767845-Hanusia_phi.AAC.4